MPEKPPAEVGRTPMNAGTHSAAGVPKDSLNALQSYLEKLVHQKMAEFQIPGVAVGTVKDGKVIYSKGFGVAELGTEKPVTPQSVFHTASVTKPFVATAVMQLVERGKVDLDAYVIRYLPYFKMDDERYRRITIRQMLSHSSGMPDTSDYHWDKPEYDDGALERYVRSLRTLSLHNPPGEKFEYSNIAYEVLGDVIAKVSGESFEDYVKQYILKPLGMWQSTLMMPEVDAAMLVSPHVSDEKGGVVVSRVFPYNRPHAPSSTLCSSVEDLNRWAMANLNRGELDGKCILRPSSYESLWEPLVPRDKSGEQFVGLGWFLSNVQGRRFMKHKGYDVGFTSILLLAPEEKASVAVLSNYSPPSKGYVEDIAQAAMQWILR